MLIEIVQCKSSKLIKSIFDIYRLKWLKTKKKQINFALRLWFLGDVIGKPSWGRDQPNNYNGEQNCVVLDGGRNWLWNDVGCNLDYLYAICQHSKYL